MKKPLKPEAEINRRAEYQAAVERFDAAIEKAAGQMKIDDDPSDYDTAVIIDEPSTFNVEERRAQKQRDREADIAAVDRGEITGEELNERNGFFSSLDRSKARILEWRKKIKLD